MAGWKAVLMVGLLVVLMVGAMAAQMVEKKVGLLADMWVDL